MRLLATVRRHRHQGSRSLKTQVNPRCGFMVVAVAGQVSIAVEDHLDVLDSVSGPCMEARVQGLVYV